MQILKEEVKSIIISLSKKEFIEYGFSGMSLRRIATEISMSVSNIYNYFKNKDEIFTEIVKPATDFIELILNTSKQKEYSEDVTPEYLEWHIQFINMIYKLIKVYKMEMILLFTKSSGSIYDGYKQNIIKKYTDIQACGKSDSNEKLISDFFMFNFTSFYVNYLENLATSDLTDEEIKKYLVEMTLYSHGGFISLLNQDCNLYSQIISSIGVD